MNLTTNLIMQLFPLYSLILIGHIAVRFLKIQKESIATLIMYIITPPVIFLGVYQAPHSHQYDILPFIFAGVAGSITLLSYFISKKIFKGTAPNTISFLSGSANVGYFGLPAITTVVGPSAFPILAQFVVGMALFQTTLGVFILARGKMNFKDGLKKTLTLPILYGFLLGMIFKKFNLPVNDSFEKFLIHFKGAYSIMGMMMIGLALKKISWTKDNKAYISYALFFKFLIWPIALFSLVYFDRNVTHLFDPFIQKVFLMLSFVPIAANTMTYSVEFKVLTEEMTFSVILSTVIAFVLFPLLLPYILQ